MNTGSLSCSYVPRPRVDSPRERDGSVNGDYPLIQWELPTIGAFMYPGNGFSPRSTAGLVLFVVDVVIDEMSTKQRTRNSNGTIASRLGVAVVMTVTVWIWIEVVGIVLGHSPRAGPFLLGEFPVIRDVTVQILRGFLAVVLTLLAVRVFDIASPVEWMNIRRPIERDWAYVPLGVMLAFVWLIGSLVLIQNVLGLERTMLLTLSERVRIARVVTLLVLVGPAEEVIFHGIIQRSLEDVIGLWPAIVAGGMLFAMTHVDPAALALGDLLFYIAQGGFGMIAGWIYARTENLVVPALIHGIFISSTTALPLLAS